MSELGTNRRNVVRGVRAGTVRALVTIPAALVVTPLVLDRLSASEYGIWAVSSTLLAVAGLADGGVRTETTRRVADAIGRGDTVAARRSAREGMTLLMALAVGVLVVGLPLAGPALRLAFPAGGTQFHEAIVVTRLVLALLSVGLVAGGVSAILVGQQRSDWESNGALAGLFLGCVASVTAIHHGAGVYALVWGAAVQLATSVAVQAIGLIRIRSDLVPLPARLSWTRTRDYIGLSSLILLSQVSNVVDFEVDKVVLARYVGSSASGAYDVGAALTLQVRAVVLVPLVVVLPGVAELAHVGAERASQLVDLASRAIAVLSVWLLGGLVLFGPSFVSLWLNADYDRGGAAARWIALAMWLNALAAAAAALAIGRGWHRLSALGALANVVVNAGVSIPLTAAIGFKGALIGSVAGNGAATVLFMVLLARRDRRAISRRALLVTSVGSASVLVALISGLPSVSSWASLIWAALAWTAVSWVVCAREIGQLRQSISRRRAASVASR